MEYAESNEKFIDKKNQFYLKKAWRVLFAGPYNPFLQTQQEAKEIKAECDHILGAKVKIYKMELISSYNIFISRFTNSMTTLMFWIEKMKFDLTQQLG